MIDVTETSPRRSPAPPDRLSSIEKIDLCRGLFAILVVVAHAADIAWAVHPGARGMYPPWLRDLLQFVVAAGIYWVIGFFVISGYCIQLSVGRSTRDGQFPLYRYLAARLTRILPLYYPALLFAVVAEWLIGSIRPDFWSNGVDGKALLAQVFVVQNMVQTFGSFAPSWSITNELFYYIYYGLLVSFALASGLRATWLGMSSCIAAALMAQAHYLGYYRSPFVYGIGQLFGMGTLWFLGALVAENRGRFGRSRAWRECSRAWPLAIACGIAMWYSRHVHLQFVSLVLGAAFALMLIRFVSTDDDRPREAGRRRASRFAAGLGLASYPMYLFHGPLLMLIGSALMRRGSVADWRITWLILVLAGVCSGVVMGYLVERPIMRWRAAFLRRLDTSKRPAIGGASPLGVMGIQQ
jgi:peptidoglycan/LPS O-acetylase OafA/YrhL